MGDGEPWGFMELMEARIEAGDSGLRAELLAKPNVGAGVLAGMHSPRTPAPASWCVGQGKGGSCPGVPGALEISLALVE